MTSYLSDKETTGSNFRVLLKKSYHFKNAIYALKVNKAQTEHKKTIRCRFFNSSTLKFQLLDFYCKLFTKILHVNKLEELEVDIVFPHLLLAKEKLANVSSLEVKAEF